MGGGCSHSNEVIVREIQESPTNCNRGESCTLRGTLTVREVDHVEMGHLELANIECVGVHLKSSEIRLFKKRPSDDVVVSGIIMVGQLGEDLVAVKVNGMRIGFSQCGGKVLIFPKLRIGLQ